MPLRSHPISYPSVVRPWEGRWSERRPGNALHNVPRGSANAQMDDLVLGESPPRSPCWPEARCPHPLTGSTTLRNGNRWNPVSRVQIRLTPCSRMSTAVCRSYIWFPRMSGSSATVCSRIAA